MVTGKRRALKQIKASVKKNHDRVGGKDLLILEGNVVLLKDHPEGRKKIQDVNKSTLFVITGLHENPNAYYIKPIDGKGSVKLVNRRQLHDLGITKEEEEESAREEMLSADDDSIPPAPVFVPKRIKSKNNEVKQKYSLHSLGPITDVKVASVELQSTRL